MKFTFILIPFSIFLCFYCKAKPNESLDPNALLQLVLPRESKFLFTFPGRDVAEDSKLKAKNLILRKIGKANAEITGYIYGLNDLDILIALRSAKERGVKLYLQGDKEEDYSEATEFGLTVNRWNGSGIHHLKIMIFDKETMLLGTGNFTTGGLVRDNNVFWEVDLTESSYASLQAILKEEESIGILRLGNAKFYFAPEAGYMIQNSILDAVRNAKRSIKFLIYTHYDPLLTAELRAACRRGVKVEGIYNDPVNPEGKILGKTLPFPCKVYADGNVDVLYQDGNYSGGLLHHKTMMIDSKKVLVGSFNFTVSARDENREFYTEFEDPSSIEEFLGEWNRLKSFARDITTEEEEESNSQKIYRLVPSFIPLALVAERAEAKPFFNKNSSGLVKEINQSFKLVDMIPASEYPRFIQERDSIGEIALPNSLDWLNSELTQISSFSVLMLWNKLQIDTIPNLEIRKIIIWDGKKSPISFPALSDRQFSVSLMDLLRQEQLVLFITENRTYFSCTRKKRDKSSRWISYFLQLEYLKDFKKKECVSF
ncbi:hypothetical protein EHQ58_08160 [Leptospira ognonensis]|uniref:phospholipase D n=1 Tax=Leptospira ognonensis TaxID=2484945 RepID=A0A4R9K1W3_9LEPT|nr:phospholipase D-like domain-containing protein [Leptospira ognonensis]TGL59709.1 hypothetical protein EHQ58_08160 [Leptospira ognonensis]